MDAVAVNINQTIICMGCVVLTLLAVFSVMRGTAMLFTYKLTDKVLCALKIKAQKLNTTPEALLNQRLDEVCNACVCEHAHERRNKVISKIIGLTQEQLEEVETLVNRLATKEVD